jgi:hypothetical protein
MAEAGGAGPIEVVVGTSLPQGLVVWFGGTRAGGNCAAAGRAGGGGPATSFALLVKVV